jgi:uncharacterized repeat protein (TIGR03803 family)
MTARITKPPTRSPVSSTRSRILRVLVTALGLIAAGQVSAQSLTTRYSFGAVSGDGSEPNAGLVLSGNTLYGTTFQGGSSGFGTVFAVNTNGTGFMTLYNFTNATTNGSEILCDGLVLSGATLYGIAGIGGTNDFGMVFAANTNGFATVFAVNTDGSGFTNLYTFNDGSDGADPYAQLVLSGSTLYGTTSRGGSTNRGTVFAINTDGSGYTNLYSFTNGTDGCAPRPGLVLSGNTLYGTAAFGRGGVGTVFSVNTNGTGFMTLYTFTGGSDGLLPDGGLVVSGNFLYGTTLTGGNSGGGTVFSLSLVAPPQLAITLSGANVILTWPTNATGFTLESTTSLLPPL